MAKFPEMDMQGKDDEHDQIFEVDDLILFTLVANFICPQAVRHWFYNNCHKICLRGPWYIKWLSPVRIATHSTFLC